MSRTIPNHDYSQRTPFHFIDVNFYVGIAEKYCSYIFGFQKDFKLRNRFQLVEIFIHHRQSIIFAHSLFDKRFDMCYQIFESGKKFLVCSIPPCPPLSFCGNLQCLNSAWKARYITFRRKLIGTVPFVPN